MTEPAETKSECPPSLALACPFAVDSYKILYERVDKVDARIQSMITLSVTVMALSPALATARHLTFSSWAFRIAVIAAAANVILGSIAHLTGKFIVIDPKILRDWIDDQPEDFQNNLVYWAGEHFDHNDKLLRRNWRFSVIVNLVFFAEAICLVLWAATAAVARG